MVNLLLWSGSNSRHFSNCRLALQGMIAIGATPSQAFAGENVDTVVCGDGEYSCHEAKFINVSKVICNGDSDFNCYYLDVFNAEKVI